MTPLMRHACQGLHRPLSSEGLRLDAQIEQEAGQPAQTSELGGVTT